MSTVPILSYDYTLKMKTNGLKIIKYIIEVQALHDSKNQTEWTNSYVWEMNIDRMTVQEMGRKY